MCVNVSRAVSPRACSLRLRIHRGRIPTPGIHQVHRATEAVVQAVVATVWRGCHSCTVHCQEVDPSILAPTQLPISIFQNESLAQRLGLRIASLLPGQLSNRTAARVATVCGPELQQSHGLSALSLSLYLSHWGRWGVFPREHSLGVPRVLYSLPGSRTAPEAPAGESLAWTTLTVLPMAQR